MGLLMDFRYAFRLLAKSPKFAILTIFILLGGLTVSLISYNYVNTIAFKALDTPEGESIVTIILDGDYSAADIRADHFSQIGKTQFKTQFSEFTLYNQVSMRLSLGETGKDIVANRVSDEFFEFTRFQPLLGRSFTPEDNSRGAPKVAAISYALWHSAFNADPQVINGNIKLNNESHRIIAVMPKGYRFPLTSEAWVPLSLNSMSEVEKSKLHLNFMARLNKNIDKQQVALFFTEHLTRLSRHTMSASELENFNTINTKVVSFQEHFLGGAASYIFGFLQFISLAILLMACINTGNLLFARAIQRQKETAIRAALGARQSRLIRQLICEGLILTVIGGGLAILLTGGLLEIFDKVMTSITSNLLPFWWHWSLDGDTLFAAIIFLVITFVFACLLPAIKAARQSINDTLRDGTRGALGKGVGKISRVLVTVQIAVISILMLVGSLSLTLMDQMLAVTGEIDQQDKYLARFDFTAQNDLNDEEKSEFIAKLLFHIGQQPGFVATSVLNGGKQTPMRLQNNEQIFTTDLLLTTGSLNTHQLPILRGRDINERDDQHAMRVVLVSESFAQRHWPDGSALDRTLLLTVADKEIAHKVVGIVTNKARNQQGLFAAADKYDEVYMSYYQQPAIAASIRFEMAMGKEHALESFYRALYAVRSDITPTMVSDYSSNLNLLAKILDLVTNTTIYIGIFSLFLALMGIYGLTANSVAIRYHEVGIRRAIGAKDQEIIKLFIRNSAKQLMVGLGLGLAFYTLICMLFSQFVQIKVESFMYIGIAVVTCLLLTSVVFIAVYLPTRNAVKLEPAVTLRAD